MPFTRRVFLSSSFSSSLFGTTGCLQFGDSGLSDISVEVKDDEKVLKITDYTVDLGGAASNDQNNLLPGGTRVEASEPIVYTVSGKAKNTSNKRIVFGQVWFDLYDEYGEVGEKWVRRSFGFGTKIPPKEKFEFEMTEVVGNSGPFTDRLRIGIGEIFFEKPAETDCLAVRSVNTDPRYYPGPSLVNFKTTLVNLEKSSVKVKIRPTYEDRKEAPDKKNVKSVNLKPESARRIKMQTPNSPDGQKLKGIEMVSPKNLC